VGGRTPTNGLRTPLSGVAQGLNAVSDAWGYAKASAFRQKSRGADTLRGNGTLILQRSAPPSAVAEVNNTHAKYAT
jgi:hypothetical protein